MNAKVMKGSELLTSGNWEEVTGVLTDTKINYSFKAKPQIVYLYGNIITISALVVVIPSWDAILLSQSNDIPQWDGNILKLPIDVYQRFSKALAMY